MWTTAKCFFADQSGATAIEYGLVASLISLAIIASLDTIGTELAAVFTSVSTNLAAYN